MLHFSKQNMLSFPSLLKPAMHKLVIFYITARPFFKRFGLAVVGYCQRRWASRLLSQCIFNRPTALESFTNGAFCDSNSSRPLGYITGNSVEGDRGIVRAVVALLPHSRPSAIFRTVWPVIINTVNSAAFWSRPHISVKVFKRFKPSVTYKYASAAVSRVSGIVRVKASGFKANPCFINGSAVHSVRRDHSTRYWVAVLGGCFNAHHILRWNTRKKNVWQPVTVTGFRPLSLATIGSIT